MYCQMKWRKRIMAYADKSCDMRRCCIVKGGHIQLEGVEFDGCDFILRNRVGWGDFESIANITKEKLIETIKEYNESLYGEEEHLTLLYQDEEDCNWDVKKEYVVLVNK